MKTGPRDADLLGVVSSLARIARVLVHERHHLRRIPPSVIAVIVSLAIWAGIS